MKSIRLLMISLFALSLSACIGPGGQEGIYSGTLVLDGYHVFKAGSVIPGGLFILSGEVELPKGAVMDGPIYLLGGKLTLGGQVNGDVSLVGGELAAESGARIAGDVRVGQGKVDLSPGVVITGQVLSGSASGVQMADVFPERSRQRNWTGIFVESFLLAGAAYLAARYTPRPLEHVRHAAIHHPVVSMAMGLLAGVVGLVFFVVIAFTLILIPVTLLGLALGVLSIGFGWAAIGSALGLHLAAWRGWRTGPAASAAGAWMFALALNLLTWLPFVGDWIYLLALVAALGAVVLTRFGLRQFVPEPDPSYEGS